ncbi:MAG: murein DD-endopeptidase MepM/ murein hydrolase activator NlpD [Bradymonadia bacterium]|jgi:murein DD-endopeptidase MepM/ murein hydrolase activator NlpD
MALAIPAFALDYNPPGQLVSGSGTGVTSTTVYAPDMRFPMEAIPAFANSQVYGAGGYLGPPGGQCDVINYDFPWSDNYCETRGWTTPLCPTGNGHQGQDIRPATCDNDTHWVVAGEDGQVTGIGTYTVTLTADSGTRYRYLHMSMDRLAVRQGDRVARGDRLGLVSNDFGGTATTYHLHFEIHQNIASVGGVTPVPTYASLVESYEELEVPCPQLPAEGGIIDNGDAACFAAFGSATYWRPVTGRGQGGSFIWTHGFEADAPSNWARWSVDLTAAGTYRVEASNLSDWIAENGFNQSEIVRYRVRHAGTETDVVLDQGDGEAWLALGEFEFAAGGDQWVAFFDNTGDASAAEAKIVADAIRLSPATGETCDEAACGARSGCDEWSACGEFADGCSAEGTQNRTCSVYQCVGSVCSLQQENAEEQACSREDTDEPGEWAAISECEGFDGLCGEAGTYTESRESCVDGVSGADNRVSECARDTDGIITSIWTPWNACDESARLESRTRTLCEGGQESIEIASRECGDVGDVDGGAETPDDDPRATPTVTSRSGCSSTRQSMPWLVLSIVSLVAVRRR